MANATASNAWLGPFCAFLASVTWAMGSAGYSRLARGHSPFAINFGRACVSLPLSLAAAAWVAGGLTQVLEVLAGVSTTDYAWLALSIFTSYGLGDVFFMWSTRSLGVPAALAIASTYPILSAIVGAWLHHEWLSVRQILGLLLAVGGVVAVIVTRAEPTPPSSQGARAAPGKLTDRTTGILLAFGAMVMWMLNGLGSARGARDVDPFVSNFVRMGMALGMSAALGRALAPGSELALPWRVLRRSLPLFVFEAFCGSVFFVYGMSHSPLAVGAALSSLAPVLSLPIALAMGLERFSLIRTLGVVAVVAGLWALVL